MAEIALEGMEFYAYHGCLVEEGKIGSDYRVDVTIKANLSKSAITDNLSDTVDYVYLNKIVKEEMAIRSKLIEHVGQRIVTRIKSEITGVIKLKVKIIKLSPPINGDVENVAIIIED